MSYDLSRILFSLNGDSFSCREFLAALEYYGILDSWKERVCEGKAFVRKAESENLKIDLDELAEMTNEFRYSEKLLSTEEFNEYLQLIQLNVGNFEDYLKRAYWSSHLEEELESEEEIDDAELVAEIYFSGAFRGLMDSWLSRLLSWYDEKGDKPQNFEELEKHFKKYKESLEPYFDAESWLKTSENDGDIDELRDLFFTEVLKTLKVKYVS